MTLEDLLRGPLTHRGLFVTFEGGEGAGKTTLIDSLAKNFGAIQQPFLRTREPGGTALGEEVRRLVLAHQKGMAISPVAELCLFLGARAQHIHEVIEPALEKGVLVMCDRFNDSTVAYQGAARGLGEEYVDQLCRLICGNTLPDLTFFLDVDPAVGLQRSSRVSKVEKAGQDGDRIEQEALDFHEKVRRSFIELQKREPRRVSIIDAHQYPEKVLDEVYDVIIRAVAMR